MHPIRSKYVPLPVTTWGIMLRLHRRPEYITKIFDNFRKLARGRKCCISVMLDRPTSEVAFALDKAIKYLPDSFTVDILDAPMPLVGEAENFMSVLQVHYEHLLGMGPVDAVSLWDDDFWFRRGGIREFRGHLASLEYDNVEARSYFLWNHPDQANEAFPAHWQSILFRVYPGHKFPEDYIVHCPHEIAQSSARKKMTHRLYNAGYLAEEERQRTFQMYKRAGKLDRHTLSLVGEPRITRLQRAI
jgi:hypothetical protein